MLWAAAAVETTTEVKVSPLLETTEETGMPSRRKIGSGRSPGLGSDFGVLGEDTGEGGVAESEEQVEGRGEGG